MVRAQAGSRRLLVGLVVAATIAVSTLLLVRIDRVAAEGRDMGTIEVIEGGGSSEPSGGGGSETTFSLRIPGTPECPGDSADENYRIQSFIVPADVDPASLRYFSVMPVGEGRYALYDVFTSPYIQALTAKATKPGGPGPIVNIPDLNFAVFPPGRLPPGRYTIGIACSLFNETVRFWDTDIQLSSAPDDQPGQMRWRVLDTPADAAGSDDPPTWVPLVGLAVLAVGGAIVVRRRRAGEPVASGRQR